MEKGLNPFSNSHLLLKLNNCNYTLKLSDAILKVCLM